MPPLTPTKYTSSPTLTAAQLQRGHWPVGSVPKVGLLCPQPMLGRYVEKHYHARRTPGLGGSTLHRLPQTALAVITGFGLGAPALAAQVELLAAWGVRQFVGVGLAGGLQPHLQPGDWVLCNRALRDEGTSYHYLPAAETIVPPASPLTHFLHAQHTGATWTTDAPFRETQLEIEHYQQRGILTVEMEAAALFAVGQVLGCAAAAAFTVADVFRAGRWQLDFDAHFVQHRLEQLLAALIAHLPTANGPPPAPAP